jgi:MFS family permease
MVKAHTMEKNLRWFDYITMNSHWFGLTTRNNVLTTLTVPLLVQQFVGEANKGAALGNLRLWALMAALLIQALFGLISDRSKSKFGRRRPFIVIGILLEITIILFIGAAAQLEGSAGYSVLFVLYILSMVGSNIAHAAAQGFIPDLVPNHKKGLASGIKAMMELPLPLIFTAFLLSGMIESGNIWGGLASLAGVLVITTTASMFVPEKPLTIKLPEINWKPFIRLIIMTGIFTFFILGSGWGVNKLLGLFQNVPEQFSLLTSGIGGLLGMVVAVFLGVITSLKIGLGEEFSRHKAFRWWVINRLAFLVAATNLANFMVFFLQEKFPSLSGSQAAGPTTKIIMFVGIFIMVFALPSGWLADKIGKRILCALASFIFAAGVLIVIFSPETTGIIFVGASIAGAGLGLFNSANWALGTKLVPVNRAGQFLGLSNLAGAGAGAIGAYIGGPIADFQGYFLVMVIFVCMAIISTFALLGINEDRV